MTMSCAWLVSAVAVQAVSVAKSNSGGKTLARLSQAQQLSESRRRDLVDSLPPMGDGHGFSSAQRPLTVPASAELTVHVLVTGSRLGTVAASSSSAKPLCRVLHGSVRLAESSAGDDLGASCSCFGGEVCPRSNCEWRSKLDDCYIDEGPLADGRSASFDASRFEAVAIEPSVVVDVGCLPRRSAGAMRLARLGPAALAEKLWPDNVERWPDDYLEEAPRDQGEPRKQIGSMPRLDKSLGVAGMDEVLAMLDTRLRLPLAAPPSILKELGVSPVKGVVLHGAPGCGKSLLARKIAQALSSEEPKVVAAPELLDKYLGASEENIRDLFFADRSQPGDLRCVVLDEIDAIATKRSESGGGGKGGADRARDSIVNQLLSIMDGVVTDEEVRILVLATTNRLDLLDPALLRPGRFEVHVKIEPPGRDARVQIFHFHTDAARRSGRLAPDAAAALDDIAANQLPDGTTGAAIAAVVRLAASFALKRYFDDHNPDDAVITLSDIRAAVADILRQQAFEQTPNQVDA